MSEYRDGWFPEDVLFHGCDRTLANVGEEAVHLLVPSCGRSETAFQTIAMVVLPDHFHCVWSLPPGDDVSSRWSESERVPVRWIEQGGSELPVPLSSSPRRARNLATRFWEHQVEGESELEHCCDYIHYNPSSRLCGAREMPWSTFEKFVKAGQYEPDWGRTNCPSH